MVVDQAGMLAQLHDGLGDVIARVVADFVGEFVAFGLSRLVAHEHAVAARFVGAFDHQLVQMLQDIFAVVGRGRRCRSGRWAGSAPGRDRI